MKKAKQALSRALRSLQGLPDAQESALYLLSHCTGGKTLPFAQKLLRSNAALTPAQLAQFEALCARRASREPLQYIIGHWDFGSLRDVAVRAPTLVPRPETEDLASLSAQVAAGLGLSQGRLLDVGTGSGVLGLSILSQLPGWQGTGIDTSQAACALARENAATCGLAQRFSVELADLRAYSPLQPVDLIVSNPPYVPEEALPTLQPEVAQWEDPGALAGQAPRGLGLPLSLLAHASSRWVQQRPGTPLLMELDSQHPALIHAMLSSSSSSAPLLLLPASGLGQPLAAQSVAPLTAAEAAQAEAAMGGVRLSDLKGAWEWVAGYYSCNNLPRIVQLRSLR